MQTPAILAFAGSTRAASLNKLLVGEAAVLASAAGARVTQIDLADYPLPLYDGDLEEEQGLPDNARKLKTQMIEHNGFLIAAPEHNGGITAVLKNAIDWVSRPQPDEPPLIAFRGKSAALIYESHGSTGGLRGLVIVRMILGNLGVLLVPEQKTIPRANQAFDDTGRLNEQQDRDAVRAVTDKLVALTGQLISD